MALGDFNLFSFKSKETRQREQEEYGKWAFPYGQAQRGALEKLLVAIFPKEAPSMSLIQFLTCKELFERAMKQEGSRDKAIDSLINEQKGYRQIIKKKDMTTFVALVIADAGIDENCEYPTAEELHAQIKELESLKR